MRCQCPNCDAEAAHEPSKCRRKAKWYIEYHAIDRCTDVDPRQVNVCQTCFDAHVNLAKRTIGWAFEGVRSTICSGCWQPLVRLSSILRDVGKV